MRGIISAAVIAAFLAGCGQQPAAVDPDADKFFIIHMPASEGGVAYGKVKVTGNTAEFTDAYTGMKRTLTSNRLMIEELEATDAEREAVKKWKKK